MIEQLVEWLRSKKVFVRKRKNDETRALGALLYFAGLSTRKTARILSAIEEVSDESVRLWYHRFQKAMPEPKKIDRKAIAMDETKIKIGKRQWFVWSAIDLGSGEILAIHLSEGRSYLDTLCFLRKLTKRCRNRPIVYVDRGPWYPWALERFGFPWIHNTFGERSPIEGWFNVLKSRTKRFWNRFPDNARMETVESWLESFALFYNFWIS